MYPRLLVLNYLSTYFQSNRSDWILEHLGIYQFLILCVVRLLEIRIKKYFHTKAGHVTSSFCTGCVKFFDEFPKVLELILCTMVYRRRVECARLHLSIT